MISLSFVLSGGGAARHGLSVQHVDPTPGIPAAPRCARLWNFLDGDNFSPSQYAAWVQFAGAAGNRMEFMGMGMAARDGTGPSIREQSAQSSFDDAEHDSRPRREFSLPVQPVNFLQETRVQLLVLPAAQISSHVLAQFLQQRVPFVQV